MHKLAFDIARINEEQGQAEGRAFSLIVHAKDAKRSYQIEVAPPEGKSYASQIAQKYGMSCYYTGVSRVGESLTGSLDRKKKTA